MLQSLIQCEPLPQLAAGLLLNVQGDVTRHGLYILSMLSDEALKPSLLIQRHRLHKRTGQRTAERKEERSEG